MKLQPREIFFSPNYLTWNRQLNTHISGPFLPLIILRPLMNCKVASFWTSNLRLALLYWVDESQHPMPGGLIDPKNRFPFKSIAWTVLCIFPETPICYEWGQWFSPTKIVILTYVPQIDWDWWLDSDTANLLDYPISLGKFYFAIRSQESERIIACWYL